MHFLPTPDIITSYNTFFESLYQAVIVWRLVRVVVVKHNRLALFAHCKYLSPFLFPFLVQAFFLLSSTLFF
jgi:hypothetical protein